MAEAASLPPRCAGCGSELAPAMLSCPSCQRLVHAGELARLAAEAGHAQATGERSKALAHWRAALELLPPGSRQHASILARIEALGGELEPAPAVAPGKSGSGLAKVLGGAGALGLLLWKFKFVAVLLLTKGKLLLLGLTKASTVFSMLLSFGVYWTAWGWQFAAGLIAAIYVHEMGHVSALRRRGIAASAPMFLPGIGAVVRMKVTALGRMDEARVGLAGPLWGAFATLAALLLAFATGWKSLFAIAHTSAWLNLFNLLPLRPLDGGRGFQSLARSERWWATAALGAAWYLTGDSIFVLLLLAAVFQAMQREEPAGGDRKGLLLYVGLVAALAAMGWIAQRA